MRKGNNVSAFRVFTQLRQLILRWFYSVSPKSYEKAQKAYWLLRSWMHGARLPFIRAFRNTKRSVITIKRTLRRNVTGG